MYSNCRIVDLQSECALYFMFCPPQLALQILLAIMVGWLANYFVSDRSLEETRDAYLYAVGIAAIFFALALNHAWAFLWAHEHGGCWQFRVNLLLRL